MTAAWAELYDDETDSSALLYEMHDTYFLVAIIDNEYIESDLYSVFTDAMVEQARQLQVRIRYVLRHTHAIPLVQCCVGVCLDTVWFIIKP